MPMTAPFDRARSGAPVRVWPFLLQVAGRRETPCACRGFGSRRLTELRLCVHALRMGIWVQGLMPWRNLGEVLLAQPGKRLSSSLTGVRILESGLCASTMDVFLRMLNSV